MKSSDNQKFWNEWAVEKGIKTASFTEKYVKLENDFTIKALKKLKPISLLDIGCGNGVRTNLFSKYIDGPVWGIDYSDEMIKISKSLNSLVYFQVLDCQKLPKYISNVEAYQKLECITSMRCFINQPDFESQVSLLEKIHTLLSSKGHLIICENILTNEQPNKFNYPIDLKPFRKEIKKYFKINSEIIDGKHVFWDLIKHE